jgi:hypothetical protein
MYAFQGWPRNGRDSLYFAGCAERLRLEGFGVLAERADKGLGCQEFGPIVETDEGDAFQHPD